MKTYRISKVTLNSTVIYEYSYNLPIYRILVNSPYRGGDIERFINNNKHIKNYLFTESF